MTSQRVGLLLLLAGLMLALGCDRDENITHCGGLLQEVGAVLIFMPTDTLTFLPGDTASVDGWAVVTDDAGRVMPDVEVALTLLEPFGSIEYLGGTDSTDAYGRVYFRFRSFNQTGLTTIRAEVGNKVDLWTLTVLPARDHVRRLHIAISHQGFDTTAGVVDSLLLCVTLSDSQNQGIEGILLPLPATDGRISPLGPTDANGRTCFWWILMGLAPGQHCLYFQFSDTVNSFCVVLDAPPVVQIVLAADTLFYFPGDTASVDGFVSVLSGETQLPLAGAYVQLTLAPAFGWLETNSPGRDTTDVEGRLRFRYAAYNQSGMTTIRAHLGLSTAYQTVWVLPATIDDARIVVHP